jgi:hypothetical protein
LIGNGIITNVDLGNKFELGTKLDPTWNFFRKKFEAKRKIPLKKMITQRQWENLSLNGKRENNYQFPLKFGLRHGNVWNNKTSVCKGIS